MRDRLVLVSVLLVGVVIGRYSISGAASAQEATNEAAAPREPVAPPTTATTPAGDGTEESPTREVGEVPAGQPRYLAALRAEIEAMGLDGACDADDAQRAHCAVVVRGEVSHRSFDLRMAYSDVTDTVYLYVDHYLTARADAATTDPLIRHMMELNWRLLVGKFEWDPADGEVRLAMVMNTDSNFDRRAFRSLVRAISDQADRLYPELTRVAPQP
ncbi:MAG: YbjN domain-containing protein [Deltaproteobacteria bacterium]|nr:YbjN domain-containing protein [Deltaproteobacteria bacterium]